MQRRRPASVRHSAAYRSPALTTAVASSGRCSNSSPFARATPSMLPNPSRCAGAHWVTTPTEGRTRVVSAAISPRWFAPSSTTAMRCAASRSHRVSGTPISLLRLPRVAETGPMVRKIAAIISLTVVLPLLPVTATGRRSWKRLLHAEASRPNEHTESRTRMKGTGTSGARSTRAAAAPRRTASAMKSCPSKLGPRTATNSAPCGIARESVPTPRNVTSPPAARASSAAAASPSRISITAAPPARAAPPPDR